MINARLLAVVCSMLIFSGVAFAFDSGRDGLVSANGQKKVLVVYYSWGGNTRSIAKKIHSRVGGDLFEIVPRDPYPKDYTAACDIAKQQKDHNITVPLKSGVDVSKYDVIFVGTPAWWGTMAIPVKSFLEANRKAFRGKTIVPFVTHGGGGKYNIPAEMKRFSTAAELKPEIVIFEGGDSSTDGKISDWLGGIGF